MHGPLRAPGPLHAARGRGRDAFALSLVLVAQDAEDGLRELLLELADDLSRRPFLSELVVVDDGSSDDTARIAAAFEGRFHALQVLRHGQPRGAGEAMRTGVAVADGECVFVADASENVPLGVLGEMISSLRSGADVVLASPRVVGDGRFDPIFDTLTGTTFRALARWLLPIESRDIDGGFRGYRREAAKRIAMRARIHHGRSARVEWLALAEGMRMQVVEISSRYARCAGRRQRGRGGDLGSLRDLWRIRANISQRKYAKARKGHAALFDTSFVRLDPAELERLRARDGARSQARA